MVNLASFSVAGRPDTQQSQGLDHMSEKELTLPERHITTMQSILGIPVINHGTNTRMFNDK